MDRIIIPLKLMGAAIDARNNKFPPLKIKGGNLKPITYKSPVASAQVKSAVLLAGLFTKGRTTVIEPAKSRDHTEKMLKLLGADIKVNGLKVSLSGPATLKGSQIEIPGDPSSAAFFVVAASLLKGSDINIVNVLHNPTRIAFIETLKKMNASLAIKNIRTVSGEEVCDIAVKSSTLKGVNIEKGSIPKLIDELPVLMVAASFAKGRTSIKGAGELRVKETDRINSITANLKKMGADIEVIESNITIEGKASLKGADFKSFGDHRTAMSMATAGLAAAGESTIDDTDCINTSFPGFLEMLDKVRNFDRVG